MFNNLEPYQGRKVPIRLTQSVGDIMAGILATHGRYRSEYDKLAPYFNKRSTLAVCESIYNYLLSNTHYVIEPNNKQTLRSPSAILHLGADPKVGVDCKSYSLFIAGILDALNRQGRKIDWCYRFASYKFDDKLPHHVFVVVNPGTDKEIWIDPVLQPFNNKKQYFYKIDKKPTMALYSISGIGAKKTKAQKQQTKAQKKQANKEKKQVAKQKIKEGIKKAGRVVVKLAPITVAGRNAFLLIVKLNMFKLAEKLALAYQKDPNKLKSFWTKFGGNFEVLKNNINQGGKKHGVAIGADPVVTPALIASATPILVALAKLMKDMGISADDLRKFAGGVIEDAIDKKAEKEAEKEAENAPALFDQESAPEESTAPEGTGTDFKKMLPLLAVAGIGAFFLLKKK